MFTYMKYLIEEKILWFDQMEGPERTKEAKEWLLEHGKLTSLGRAYFKTGIPFTEDEMSSYLNAKAAKYKRVKERIAILVYGCFAALGLFAAIYIF